MLVAAKSLQSCRQCMKVESEKWKWSRSVVPDSQATPWTAAHQAPPSTGVSRQEYWSRVPLPSLITPEHHQLIFCAKAGALRPHVKWSLMKQTDVSGKLLETIRNQREEKHISFLLISHKSSTGFSSWALVSLCLAAQQTTSKLTV